ncbi:hypothetical protein DPMN_096134 [Dreissena polymorpha]|uniref:Uncharacterized protein n=1 Tax=Dreissena polymorpha TaxID=45954 RepID=A0A9D4R3I2_DREPO|nr:hypothetical protein DPMN_096134 [Dreissena polymorpha]
MSPKLDNRKPAYTIRITGILKKRPTALQIALMRNLKKTLTNQMHGYSNEYTFNEVLHFKTSAAMCATSDTNVCAIYDCNAGLSQTVVYKFNAVISSQRV